MMRFNAIQALSLAALAFVAGLCIQARAQEDVSPGAVVTPAASGARTGGVVRPDIRGPRISPRVPPRIAPVVAPANTPGIAVRVDPRPPAIGATRGEVQVSDYQRFVRAFYQIRPRFTYLLPAAAMILILIYVAISRWKAPFLRGLLLVPLLLAGLLSVGHYMSFYPWLTKSYFNHYEFFHYYIGAKYAPELGYTHLYHASLAADDDTKLLYTGRAIRDLGTNQYVGVKDALKEKAKCRALFSDARWQEFMKDIKYFKRGMGAGRWSRVLADKGYNATPVWGLVGGLLSNAVSTDNEAGMQALALLDPALIALALLALLWAFGPRTMLFIAAFFGANYVMMQSPTMKQAFLRTDWVMGVLIGIALVKKKWHMAAGAVMAYAGLARIFPIIFVFGMGARGLIELVRTRRIPWPHVRFFLGFGVAGVALIGASMLYFGGMETWREFFAKINYHNNDISTWRIGFRYVFLGTFDVTPAGVGWWDYKAQLQAFMAQYQYVWWAIQGVVLLLCLCAARDLDDDEALALGFVPVFFLVAPTHYYYLMLLVPALYFAPKVDQPLRAVGLLLLFGSAMLCASHNNVGWRFPMPFDMSCIYLAMVVYMMLVAVLEARLRRIDAAHTLPDAAVS